MYKSRVVNNFSVHLSLLRGDNQRKLAKRKTFGYWLLLYLSAVYCIECFVMSESILMCGLRIPEVDGVDTT